MVIEREATKPEISSDGKLLEQVDHLNNNYRRTVLEKNRKIHREMDEIIAKI